MLEVARESVGASKGGSLGCLLVVNQSCVQLLLYSPDNRIENCQGYHNVSLFPCQLHVIELYEQQTQYQQKITKGFESHGLVF
jgi:hypothetical protein